MTRRASFASLRKFLEASSPCGAVVKYNRTARGLFTRLELDTFLRNLRDLTKLDVEGPLRDDCGRRCEDAGVWPV